MRCSVCQRERPLNFFLPSRASLNRQSTCVDCLREHYHRLVVFLENACRSPSPDTYLHQLTGPPAQAARTITCVEKKLASLQELKQELAQQYVRPEQQKRLDQALHIYFRCRGQGPCDCQLLAMETKAHGSWVLQILQPHSCDPASRNPSQEQQEVSAFRRFVERLKVCVPSQLLTSVAQYPTEYRQVSQVYKELQAQLHATEDEAIASIWGLPCPWRRARGNPNQPAQLSDLARLALLAKDKAPNATELAAYIAANLHTTTDSPYFQQRGYFVLLSLSTPQQLKRILQARIAVLLYAERLLQQEMQVLCYKRLNTTVLRNHVLLVLLLMRAWRAQQGREPWPLMGLGSPQDSAVPDFYMVLDSLPDEFFHSIQLTR